MATETGKPTTQAELETMLEDGDLATAIRSTMAREMDGVVTEAKDALTEYLNEQKRTLIAARSEVAAVRGGRLPLSEVHKHNPRARGATLDGKFSTLGEFAVNVFRANNGRGLHEALQFLDTDGTVKSAMAEGAGDTGGFLVPEEFRAQIAMLSIEGALIRPRAFQLPMSSGTMRMPTIKDTSHVASVFGGVVGYWENEAATIAESEPTFSQMQMIARKLAGYTVASNELLSDSGVALEAVLMQLFPQAITYFEEEAFFNGIGDGQPIGLLRATCKIAVAVEAGQTISNPLVYENLNNMYARMLPTSKGRAIWLANIDTMPALATMALAVGTGGTAVFIPQGGMQAEFPMAIWGRPVFFTEHCQTLGTEGDIMFVDPTYYVVADRQELSIMSSAHVRFTTDETVWRFIERLDAKPWLESALTPRHGANTLSPIVTLATRS